MTVVPCVHSRNYRHVKSALTTSRLSCNMPYAIKAKTQQFTRRKPNLIKKVDQLAHSCHVDFALIVHQEYQPVEPVDDLLDYADSRDSGDEPKLAAKTPKTEVTLLIHISLGQVAQIHKGKQPRQPQNMPYAAKAKTQQFTRRKPNLLKRQISWHDYITPTLHSLSEGMEGIIYIGRLITSSSLLLF